MKKTTRLILPILFMGLFTSSCDTFAPSQLCGDTTEADHETFGQYFSEIHLMTISSSESNDDQPQIGRVFKHPAILAINGSLIKDSNIRFCIFGAKRNGEVVFDKSFSLNSGDISIEIGEFTKGPYMIRVYADGVLIENISFLIQE